MRIVKLTSETKTDLLNSLLKRSPNNYAEYEQIVADIIYHVRTRRDEAIFEYTEKFDKCRLNADTVRVTAAEIQEAYTKVDAQIVEIMKRSAENIRAFHTKQLHNSWIDTKADGTILGQKITKVTTKFIIGLTMVAMMPSILRVSSSF